MSDSEFTDDRMALGETPIPGDAPAGAPSRYEPEYEAVESEFRKLESEGPSAVNWRAAASAAEVFLSTKSKDLLVGSYYAYALERQEGLRGLAVGLGVLRRMADAHWDGLAPPRERARASAAEWLASRVGPGLVELQPTQSDWPVLLACADAAEGLNTKLRDGLQKESANLSDLLTPLRRFAQEIKANQAAEEQRAREALERAERDRLAAEAAAVEAEQRAAAAAEEADRQAQADATAKDENARAAQSALAGIGGALGADASDPTAQLAALAAAITKLAQLRMAGGEADETSVVLAVSSALAQHAAALAAGQGAAAAAPRDALAALAEAGDQDLPAVARLLSGSCAATLTAWRSLSLGLTAADRAEDAAFVADTALLMTRRFPTMTARDADDEAWLKGLAPVAAITDPVAEILAAAAALSDAGDYEQAMTQVDTAARDATSARDRFRCLAARTRIALNAGAGPAALHMAMQLSELVDANGLDSWEPRLAAEAHELVCRSAASPGSESALPPEARAAAHAAAFARLCRIDGPLALVIAREAPPG